MYRLPDSRKLACLLGWNLVTGLLVVAISSGAALLPALASAQEGGGDQPAAEKAESPAGQDVAADQQLVITFLHHVPAKEIAAALGRAIQDTGARSARIVPEPTSNALFITATPEVVEKVASLVKGLDRPPRRIVVRALLAQLHRGQQAAAAAPDESEPRRLLEAQGIDLSAADDEVLRRVEQLDREGKLTIVNRIRLATLENQEAFLQAGENRSVMTSYTGPAGGDRGRFGGSRPFAANFQTVQVGTLLRVKPQMMGDTIQLAVEFERSELEPPRQPAGEDDERPQPAAPGSTLMTTLQTTVTVTPGKAVLIGGFDQNSESQQRETVLILTAELVKP